MFRLVAGIIPRVHSLLCLSREPQQDCSLWRADRHVRVHQLERDLQGPLGAMLIFTPGKWTAFTAGGTGSLTDQHYWVTREPGINWELVIMASIAS